MPSISMYLVAFKIPEEKPTCVAPLAGIPAQMFIFGRCLGFIFRWLLALQLNGTSTCDATPVAWYIHLSILHFRTSNLLPASPYTTKLSFPDYFGLLKNSTYVVLFPTQPCSLRTLFTVLILACYYCMFLVTCCYNQLLL